MTVRIKPLVFAALAVLLISGCNKTRTPYHGSPSVANTPAHPASAPAAVQSPPSVHPAIAGDPDNLEDAYATKINATLAAWKPTEWDLHVPPKHLRDSSLDVVGEWRHGGGFSGQNITVSRRDDGNYNVDFLSYSCTSDLRLRRKATYQDGILALDVPLEDERIFKQLYAIRVGDHRFLVAPSYLSELERITTSSRSTDTPVLNDENDRRIRRIGYVRPAATSEANQPNNAVEQSSFEVRPDWIRADLAAWTPKAQDLRTPPEHIRDRSIDVAGEWTQGGGFGGSRFRLTRQPDGDYDVDFVGFDCTWILHVQRTATYRDGVLTLDAPVKGEFTFKTLYAVRILDRPLLAPPGELDELLNISRNPRGIDKEISLDLDRLRIKHYAYLRPAEGD